MSYTSMLTPPSSNEDSPPVYFIASPNSAGFSVPETYLAEEMICDVQPDTISGISAKNPFLRIVEQPLQKFRFRYKSEMVGTHGSLTGINSDRSRKQTFPSVELVNFHEQAIIRCSIYQITGIDQDLKPHPHRLVKKRGKEEFDDPHHIYVGPDEGYVAEFHSMGIIHTARKHLVSELLKKRVQLEKEFISRIEGKPRELTSQEIDVLQHKVEQESKTINLNIVCLRFDAFIERNDIWYPICKPVYSHRINNLKSAAHGDLKIMRMDHCSSPASGDRQIFILVERVAKKNIRVRFYELDDDGQEVWEGEGKFTEYDVHHQYAIVFSTPKYKDENITKPVKVYMELVRPTDMARSEPREFTYTPCKRGGKRPRPNEWSSMSSMSITSDELPVPVKNYQASSLKKNDSLDSKFTVGSEELMKALNNVSSTEFNELFNEFEPEYPIVALAEGAITFDNPNYKRTGLPLSRLSLEQQSEMIKTEEGIDREDQRKAFRVYNELRSFIKTKFPQEKAIQMLDHYLGKEDETNALHTFILLGRQVELEFLFKFIYKFKPDLVNICNRSGLAPIHLATMCNDVRCINHLLLCNADITKEDYWGNNALHFAVINYCSPEVLKELLNIFRSRNESIDAKNHEGDTPLFIAVAKRNMEALKILCENNADVNIKHQNTGYTPLRFALEKQYLEAIKYFLTIPHLDPTIKDFSDVSVLDAISGTECSKDIIDVFESFMNKHKIQIKIKEEPEEEEDPDEDMEEIDIKPEPTSTEELSELYKDITNFTPTSLEMVSSILNESNSWKNLADLLELNHLFTSNIISSEGNPSKSLLTHAVETKISIWKIRSCLEALNERKAIEVIDEMVRTYG